MSFKIAFGSCAQRTAVQVAWIRAVARNPDLICIQGDTPYTGDSAASFRGYTTTACTISSTVPQIFAAHQQTWADPGFQAVTAFRQSGGVCFYMPDDHEWGGDNWDATLTRANTAPSIGASTQAEVDATSWVCVQAMQQAIAAYADNQTNTDPGVAAQKPSSADAGTSVSQYPPLYFRSGFTFDGELLPYGESGDVEVFTISNVMHRSPIAATDNASKTMLGTTQKAWLKTWLLASTATWKVINSTKKTFKSTSGDNGDTYGEYTTERNEILDYIASNGITGVVWLAGDKHRPHVISQSIAGGYSYDHVCIVGCPIGVPVNALLTGVTTPGIVWQGSQRCYGWAEFTSTEALLKIYAVQNDALLWAGRMISGSNAMSYASQRLIA